MKRAWCPPKGELGKVVVYFDVNKSGGLSNLRLKHFSGSVAAEKSAMNAIDNAAPFKPLIPSMTEPARIQFNFQYNNFGGSGRASFRSF